MITTKRKFFYLAGTLLVLLAVGVTFFLPLKPKGCYLEDNRLNFEILPNKNKKFTKEGTLVFHNNTSSPVLIKEIQISCDCTNVVSVMPEQVPPKSKSIITLKMQLKSKDFQGKTIYGTIKVVGKDSKEIKFTAFGRPERVVFASRDAVVFRCAEKDAKDSAKRIEKIYVSFSGSPGEKTETVKFHTNNPSIRVSEFRELMRRKLKTVLGDSIELRTKEIDIEVDKNSALKGTEKAEFFFELSDGRKLEVPILFQPI